MNRRIRPLTTRRTLLRLLASLGWVSPTLQADDFFFGRKLKSRCCLPEYGYDGPRFTNPVTARSVTSNGPAAGLASVGRPVTSTTVAVSPGPANSAVQVRAFEFRPTALQIDHCSLSQLSVCFTDAGRWYIAATATQDPASVEPARRPAFERFLRNQFRLQLRPVLLSASTPTAADSVTGDAEISLCDDLEFWVQKGESRKMSLQGDSPELANLYDRIERVHLHFSIR